jgi:lipoprotein-anchoring transpeptidase ErfK/SrfK
MCKYIFGRYGLPLALLVAASASAGATSDQAGSASFDITAVNKATLDSPLPEGISPQTLKLQVIFDQIGISPGVIDGANGKNLTKAIAAFEELRGLPVDGTFDQEVGNRLSKDGPVLVEYKITEQDVAGPFLAGVPEDFSEMAKLDQLSFASPLEMLGERFHMDVDLLKALNSHADFNRPGTRIVVARIGEVVTQPVAALIADKETAQLRGYDKDGKLVVAYPASIGSEELPSPTGTHVIRAIATEAAYYYNPEINFTQGDNTEKLTIQPGPNNPIGTTWIDLSDPTYGIHGTPEPSKIDKTNSHGCVRLTNWDVEELATLVRKGVQVDFR